MKVKVSTSLGVCPLSYDGYNHPVMVFERNKTYFRGHIEQMHVIKFNKTITISINLLLTQ